MTTRLVSSFWSAWASKRKVNTMKDILMKRAAKLLSVKSIVTIALTAVFTVLSIRGTVTGQDFLTVFLMVISFYFGTQSQKNETQGKENAE